MEKNQCAINNSICTVILCTYMYIYIVHVRMYKQGSHIEDFIQEYQQRHTIAVYENVHVYVTLVTMSASMTYRYTVLLCTYISIRTSIRAPPLTGHHCQSKNHIYLFNPFPNSLSFLTSTFTTRIISIETASWTIHFLSCDMHVIHEICYFIYT